MLKILLVFLVFASAKAINAQPFKATPVHEMVSPNGDFKLELRLNAEGTPVYKLDFLGKEAIKESSLGFDLKGDDKSLKDDFELVEVEIFPFGMPLLLMLLLLLLPLVIDPRVWLLVRMCLEFMRGEWERTDCRMSLLPVSCSPKSITYFSLNSLKVSGMHFGCAKKQIRMIRFALRYQRWQ